MALLDDGTYGLRGPRHRMVGWYSRRTPFGKFRILRSIIRPGDLILDIGCGTGMLIDWLRRGQYDDVRYMGMDLSSPFLESFKSRYPAFGDCLYFGDALAEDGIPLSGDVALSVGLTSDLHTLDEAARLLKNVTQAARDVSVVEFWNKDTFRPKGTGIPPSSWDPEEIMLLSSGLPGKHYLVDPLYKGDFAVVTFK